MSGLPTRPLGASGLEITTVGLGAWAIGGGGWAYGWGPQDDATSIATIRHAVERGVNWIDTAAVYGLGHSETVVGQALKDFSDADRPYVFTKCGIVRKPDDPSGPAEKIGRADSLRAEVDASLRRLGVERLDLIQIHWPPTDGTKAGEFWGTLLALKDAGKVRAAGVSNFRLGPLVELEAIGHVDSLQPRLSLLNQQAAEELIPWCDSHETGVITYSPLQSGLLTGTWNRERVAALPSDDWRRTAPDFTHRLATNLELVERLRDVAARHQSTLAAVAIAWVLQVRGVSGAIVGARSPQQIDDWIGATAVQLHESDLAKLT